MQFVMVMLIYKLFSKIVQHILYVRQIALVSDRVQFHYPAHM